MPTAPCCLDSSDALVDNMCVYAQGSICNKQDYISEPVTMCTDKYSTTYCEGFAPTLRERPFGATCKTTDDCAKCPELIRSQCVNGVYTCSTEGVCAIRESGSLKGEMCNSVSNATSCNANKGLECSNNVCIGDKKCCLSASDVKGGTECVKYEDDKCSKQKPAEDPWKVCPPGYDTTYCDPPNFSDVTNQFFGGECETDDNCAPCPSTVARNCLNGKYQCVKGVCALHQIGSGINEPCIPDSAAATSCVGDAVCTETTVGDDTGYVCRAPADCCVSDADVKKGVKCSHYDGTSCIKTKLGQGLDGSPMCMSPAQTDNRCGGIDYDDLKDQRFGAPCNDNSQCYDDGSTHLRCYGGVCAIRGGGTVGANFAGEVCNTSNINTDCTIPYLCQDSVCRTPLGVVCKTTGECSTGLVCDGRCVVSKDSGDLNDDCVTLDAPCRAPYKCKVTAGTVGACKAPEFAHCNLDTDCENPSFKCLENTCQHYQGDIDEFCTSLSDCKTGMVCEKNLDADDGTRRCKQGFGMPCTKASECFVGTCKNPEDCCINPNDPSSPTDKVCVQRDTGGLEGEACSAKIPCASNALDVRGKSMTLACNNLHMCAVVKAPPDAGKKGGLSTTNIILIVVAVVVVVIVVVVAVIYGRKTKTDTKA
jgi:hypothetical protein